MKPYNLKKNVLPVLRILNLIILSLAGLMIGNQLICSERELFDISSRILAYGLVISPLISITIVDKIKRKYEFFEWDKLERKKKSSFVSSLTTIVFFFSYLSIFAITGGIVQLLKSNYNLNIDSTVLVLIGIYFLLNAIFTVKLHHKIYENELTKGWVVKKPDNYDKEIRERTMFDDMDDSGLKPNIFK